MNFIHQLFTTHLPTTIIALVVITVFLWATHILEKKIDNSDRKNTND